MENPNKTSSPNSQGPANAMTVKEDLGGRSVTASGSTASDMVAAQTEAEVKAGFALAQIKRRDEEDSRVGILRACNNSKFAEKAIYKKPIGKTTIEGPSIRFAEEMIRNWRNVKIIQQVIFDSPRNRIIRVICYDLEANIPYGEDIIIDKTVERRFANDRDVISERVNTRGEKISIVIATEDEVKTKQAANVSKAIRNNGLRLIPSHIIDEAMDKCREVLRAGVKNDPMAERRKMIDSFAKLGINPSDISNYLGKPLEQIIDQDIIDLKTVFNSIKDGEATWAEILASKDDSPEVVSPSKQSVGAEEARTWEDLENNLNPGDPATHTHPGEKQPAPKKDK
jgi:hypothetical protein